MLSTDLRTFYLTPLTFELQSYEGDRLPQSFYEWLRKNDVRWILNSSEWVGRGALSDTLRQVLSSDRVRLEFESSTGKEKYLVYAVSRPDE